MIFKHKNNTLPVLIKPQDKAILRCVAAGCDSRACGKTMGLSHRTIANHTEKLKFDLDALTLCNLVYVAFKEGVINTDEFEFYELSERKKMYFEQHRAMLTLLALGKTQKQIAGLVYKSHQVVVSTLYILKLCVDAVTVPHLIAVMYSNNFFDN